MNPEELRNIALQVFLMLIETHPVSDYQKLAEFSWELAQHFIDLEP